MQVSELDLVEFPYSYLRKLLCRPLKKVLFNTTRLLGAKERRDSRQNIYENRSKEQCFEAICEHITAIFIKACKNIRYSVLRQFANHTVTIIQ